VTPVFQTIIDPEIGDCERACVATITGIPIDEIPNFADPEARRDHTQWKRQWLQSRGFGLIEPKRGLGAGDYVWTGLRGLAAMATVPSQAFPGGKHAIVVGWRPDPRYPEAALECFVVHDPNPNNEPYEDVKAIIERTIWIVPHMLGAA